MKLILVKPSLRGSYRGGRNINFPKNVNESVNENSEKPVSKWLDYKTHAESAKDKDIDLTDANVTVCPFCGDLFRGQKDRNDHVESMHPGQTLKK